MGTLNNPLTIIQKKEEIDVKHSLLGSDACLRGLDQLTHLLHLEFPGGELYLVIFPCGGWLGKGVQEVITKIDNDFHRQCLSHFSKTMVLNLGYTL